MILLVIPVSALRLLPFVFPVLFGTAKVETLLSSPKNIFTFFQKPKTFSGSLLFLSPAFQFYPPSLRLGVQKCTLFLFYASTL